jgi:hypothetical protein
VAGIGRQLFTSLVDDASTAGEAYDAAEPKVDALVTPGTRFLMTGGRDVAYLEKPRFEPEHLSLPAGGTGTLTVEMPGTEDCDLLYHWLLLGSVSEYNGYLSGGDDVERTGNTATYIAANPLVGGTDTIRVEVFALGSGGRRVKLGRAEATVSVSPSP